MVIWTSGLLDVLDVCLAPRVRVLGAVCTLATVVYVQRAALLPLCVSSCSLSPSCHPRCHPSDVPSWGHGSGDIIIVTSVFMEYSSVNHSYSFGITSVLGYAMHLESGATGYLVMPGIPDMYMHACSTPRSLHTTLWYSRLLDVLRHLIPRHHVDLWTQIHRDSESSWSSGPRDYWMY